MKTDRTRASEENLHLPTYEPAAPEALPIFYQLRNYQNTRGDIYPLQATEWISDEKTDHAYRAVRLENEYLRVTVLPELGGRIWEGYDKPGDYNFVYKNNVIKPALIGLCGPWISGGIEFNWPQHHRPTTFMPTDARRVENPDGSQTVWMGEIEPKDGTKGMVGVTVEPGRSRIRAKVRLYNRTPDVKSFHWWANLAVHVDDGYRLIFPPDIDYVAYHYKSYVSPFPVVKGEFATAEFGEGRDVSYYRNVHEPASFFVFNSNYGFMAGYDYEKDRGTVHVADRHVSPGKKFFTWGTDDFARAWQDNLTDADGPYIEIMTGCYTDNQPDFAWLQPYETKTFEECWYPLRGMPYLKNATVDAAVSLGAEGNVVRLAFNATGAYKAARYVLREGGAVLAQGETDISPDEPFSLDVRLDHAPDVNALSAALVDAEGRELVEYHRLPMYFENRRPPKPHKPAPKPSELNSVEALFLNGLHIEQYRNPTFEAEAYYREGLRRDPSDSRCNLAMGRLEMRRGRFEQAKEHLLRCLTTLTDRNPNPYDGEAYYQLGRALRALGDADGALTACRKAAWNYAQSGCALHESAELEARRGALQTAAACAEQALQTNRYSLKTRLLLCALYRRLGRKAEAAALCRETREVDALDYGAPYELYLLTGEETYLSALRASLRGSGAELLTLARDYLDFGFWDEALGVCGLLNAAYAPGHYAAGLALVRLGRAEDARVEWAKAENCDVADANPTDFGSLEMLAAPGEAGAPCGKACYLLGNLCYARGAVPEAQAWWAKAAREGLRLGALHRNLALALFEHDHDRVAARREMELAFGMDSQSPRMLLETELLYRALCVAPGERLRFLEAHAELLPKRYDLYVEYVSLLNLCGEIDKALHCLQTYSFHTYEGGEGVLPREHLLSHVLAGLRAESAGDSEAALSYYRRARVYPPNYHEGRKSNAREGALDYRIGAALAALGRADEAGEAFRACAAYADGLDETGCYKALALRRLGDPAGASRTLRAMAEDAEKTLAGDGRFGYFDGFPAGTPFNEDMATITRVRCLTALLYACVALGDRAEEARAQRELSTLTADTPWLSVIRADVEKKEGIL